MSDEEKVENDLLLVGVTILNQEENVYELNVPDNYSKLRAGDKVTIAEEGASSAAEAMILDVFFDTITISCEKQLNTSATFSIEQKSPELLQSLISCLEGIYGGVPGAGFLRLLSGEDEFFVDDFMKVDVDDVPCFDNVKRHLNVEQLNAVGSMLEYPPVHVLQGPPGTGKTLVLAATAIASSRKDREVVIIANTHQAVNNALQKIRDLDKSVTLFKIGPSIKAEGLDDSVLKLEKFSEYYDYSYKNKRKKKSGYIVGMTIWGAIAHLGLRHHAHFRPYQALVDEASLMPLTLSTILGKTAPSICLFGDSRQMPPIFRSELQNNKFSISILDYCANYVKGVPVTVLHTTYRMNQEITSMVSSNFYEPYGVKLISSDFSKDRVLDIPCFNKPGMQGSVVYVPSNTENKEYEDCNPEEASQVIDLVKTILSQGVQPKDVAVITPWRKQVRALRERAAETLGSSTLVLIDTVERLQGQDVDCIILSFASTNPTWIQGKRDFIFNPNRLNVMISRAKKKVIIFGLNQSI